MEPFDRTEKPTGRPSRRFLPLEDVAETLSLGYDDVEAMVGSGELPAIRVGPADSWRVEESVLDSFIEAKYEESRRSAVFDGFDFGSVADIDPAGR